MIVNFALDPTALAFEAFPSELRLVQTERFIDVWTRYGVLVIPRGGTTQFLEALKSLPPSEREKWFAAIQHNKRQRRISRVPEWSDVYQIRKTDAGDGIEPDVDLICLTSQHIEEWQTDQTDDLSVELSQDLEAIRYDSADQAKCFRRVAELATYEIIAGTPNHEVWSERFEPILRNSRSVSIVDRYCLASGMQGYKSGLEYFLSKLPPATQEADLTIITAPPDSYDDESCARYLQSVAPHSSDQSVRRITLILYPDRLFSQKQHDRYINFDDWQVSLGTGLEPLARTNGESRACSFTFRRMSPNLKADHVSLVSLVDAGTGTKFDLPLSRD